MYDIQRRLAILLRHSEALSGWTLLHSKCSINSVCNDGCDNARGNCAYFLSTPKFFTRSRVKKLFSDNTPVDALI